MPASPRDDALAILLRLRAAGYEAYFAGGCVRDLLMGQAPQDYDVATSAKPDQVRGIFQNTQAVGAAFGVILVREKNSTIEVATFRTDLAYKDGRRPTGVQFATACEDANRRDFTINGLFLDPVENQIIDYVDGEADLHARRLRAIGNADQRFAEDHLRLLRAVRFASRFNFEIAPTTATAIQTHAHQLIRISPERIAQELRKMLMPPTRDQAFLLLRQFGLIKILMRFLPEKLSHCPDETFSLFLALRSEHSISFGLALAGILLDFRMHASGNDDPRFWLTSHQIKRVTHAMRQTLKISNDESNELIGSLSFIQLLDNQSPSLAVQKRFLHQPHAADGMLLMTALKTCGLMPVHIQHVLDLLNDLCDSEIAPPPLITGNDLTAAGAAPGPKFKQALDAAYDAQLENKITTKDQAMALARGVLS